MKPVGTYAAVSLLLLLAALAAVVPWLDAPARRGVVVAACAAWPVQVVAFGAMVRLRSRTQGLLMAWGGGMLARLLLVGVAALAVWVSPGLPPAPTLLGLVAVLFGMLLLEGPFLMRLPGPDDDDDEPVPTATAGTPTASRVHDGRRAAP
jgi:hypothetical protein